MIFERFDEFSDSSSTDQSIKINTNKRQKNEEIEEIAAFIEIGKHLQVYFTSSSLSLSFLLQSQFNFFQ